MSVRLKVALAVIVLFIFAGAAVLWTTQGLYRTAIDRAASTSVATAANAFASLEAQDIEKLAAANDVLRSRSDLRDAFAARDRDLLYELSLPIFEELRENYAITHLYFELPEPESTVFLRTHNLDKRDDVNKRDTYALAVETKSYGVGKDLGVTAFALRVVHPWYDDAGELLGYVETGQEIEEFLDLMAAQSGDQLTLLLQKDKLDAEAWATMRENRGDANNWDEYTTYVDAHSTAQAPDAAVVNGLDVAGLADEGTVLTDVASGDALVVGAFPVNNTKGEPVGVVIVEHDISELQGQLAAARTQTMIIMSGVGVVLVLVVVLMLNALVFKRLTAMINHMEDASIRLAGGDFDIAMPATDSDDEIGQFEKFFGSFIEAVSSTIKQLTK
ncbi:MAG: cache domain-containing protein [Coriobacteriia bacterium]|nr:cache domain-containing protein [Coriobacteriia bacterium]